MKASRRREQNRASQRRFRAKKENEIRGAAGQVASLELLVQDLQMHNTELGQANQVLKKQLAELENQRASGQADKAMVRCDQCKGASTDNRVDLFDFFMSVDDDEPQQTTRLGTYLPLFDHELLPFNI